MHRLVQIGKSVSNHLPATILLAGRSRQHWMLGVRTDTVLYSVFAEKLAIHSVFNTAIHLELTSR